MIISILKNWIDSAKSILTSPSTLGVFAILYALLLASLYGFIATREATVWQVFVTFVLLVLVPAEFFILQSAIVTRALDGKFQWRRILRVAFKLFVVSIPIVIIAYLLFKGLNRWQAHYPPPAPIFDGPHGQPRPQPIHQASLLFSTMRSILFGIILPLATIHLWLELAANEVKQLFAGGVKPFFTRFGNVMASAFASDSVLTYALGLMVFVVLPFAVLFAPIAPKGNKTDFAVFIARLLLAFALTLIGWAGTLTALSRLRDQESPAVEPEPVAVEAAA